MRRASARRWSLRRRWSAPHRQRRRARSAAPDPPRLPARRSTPPSSTASGRPPRRSAPGNRGLEYGTEPGTPVARGRRRAGDLRRLGRRHPARHGAPRRRRPHDLLVPPARRRRRRAARAPGRPGRADRRPPPLRRPAGRQLLRSRRRCSARHAVGAPGALRRASRRRRAGERSAIGQLIDGAGRLLDGAGGAAGAVGTWLRDGGSQLLRTARPLRPRASPSRRRSSTAGAPSSRPGSAPDAAADRPCTAGRRSGAATAGPTRRACSSPGSDRTAPAPPSTRCAPTSSGTRRPTCSGSATRAGGCPTPPTGFAAIPVSDYGAAETQDDLRAHGQRLADLVEQVAAGAPGVPIDLIAHSQGGVVARLALIELERRHGDAWLDRVGMFATLGSPHGGADLATAVHAWSSTEHRRRGARRRRGGHRPGARRRRAVDHAAGRDLRPGRGAGRRTPCRTTIHAVSIAARGDLVVPVPRSRAPGHGRGGRAADGHRARTATCPAAPEATRELALARAGLPPGCQSFRDALLDQGVGEGISLLEDLAGPAASCVAARADVRGG